MNRIKEIREIMGIKQKDLAIKAGVSKPYLYDLENQRRGAKRETLERIAAVLNVDVSDLFKDEKNVLAHDSSEQGNMEKKGA